MIKQSRGGFIPLDAICMFWSSGTYWEVCDCEKLKRHAGTGPAAARSDCERFYLRCQPTLRAPRLFCSFRWRRPSRPFPSPCPYRNFSRRTGFRAFVLSAFGLLLHSVAPDLAARIHRTGARAAGDDAGSVLLVLLRRFEDLLPLCQRVSGRLATGRARGEPSILRSPVRAFSFDRVHTRCDQSLRSLAFQCRSRLCTSCPLRWQNACS